ncbi:MAG TPA: 5'-nucleotidase C-terminal domain-containing protein, partial [Aggregatilineales bacterium]|nr:5'-nucleotidase C-terminal domain-containing protein [Aggregatilineales bacterium]
SANLDFSGEPRLQELFDQGRIARSVVVKERGENIGIIGATTPALPFISSPRNVIVNDVAPAIMAEVERLEAMGINKIILISHLQSIEEDLALAPLLDGIDIMVAGGGDELLANEGDLLLPGGEAQIFGPYPLVATDMDGTQVPVVTTQGSYNYVGQLVATFDKQGNLLGWNEALSGPVRVAGGDNPDAVQPDPEVQALVVDPIVAELAEMANNVIATSEVGLDGIRTNVRTRETNEGNLIADALLWQATQLAASFGAPEPDVALQNGGGIRNDSVIGPGNITELHTFDMVPFANFTAIVHEVPREQFKEILENAVSNVENTDGRFAQIAGFSYTWDATGTAQVLNADGTVATPGTRVRDVVLDDGTVIVSGGVVQPGDPLAVATIDFLARGGDQYPFRGAAFTTVGVTYQQAVFNYIVDALGGAITAADYPEGGEGRITRIN